MEKIVRYSATHQHQIIGVFKVFFYTLFALLFIGGYAVYAKNEWSRFFFELGSLAGKVAIVMFVFTLAPGIARRFDIRHPILTVLMLFRRYFGISVYLLVLFHSLMLRTIDRVRGVIPATTPVPLFEVYGAMAMNLLLLLFLTSNSFSVSKMGKWWGRLHKLVYVIAWLGFGHVYLQDPTSVWSILIGAVAVLEVVSLLYSSFAKPKKVV